MQHLEEVVNTRIEHLVVNRQMGQDDVNWHRGYIAAHREFAIYIEKDLTKKINEA